MPSVLIIQSEMKRYRIPLFVSLHQALERDGIRLTVAYSNTDAAHASRKDREELSSPTGLRVPGYWLFNKLLYQPLWKQILEADLVITGPEVKYLLNLPLITMSALRLKKVAFWGLGPNRHPDRSPLAEWLKQHFFTSVDWWFAYTASVAHYLEQEGMAAGRITNVQNATDTSALTRQIAEIPDAEVLAKKIETTGSADSKVALYCGMIHRIKSIPLLIHAARRIKKSIPAFHLVIIGSGPEKEWLERDIADERWIHYLGSLYGRESALYYKMAHTFLLPGTAGLAIADSFAAGLPIIATELPTHPPEISYIVHGKNGMISRHEPKAFAEAVLEVLSNPELADRLKKGAQESGRIYTLESMVENFRTGIHRCLAGTRVGFPHAAMGRQLEG